MTEQITPVLGDEGLLPDSGAGTTSIDHVPADDETAGAPASSAGEEQVETDEEEHLVPLRHLLEARSRLTATQQREREAADWRAQYEPLLLEFQARVPEFRQAVQERHSLLQEKEIMTRRVEAQQAAMLRAKETGEFDFDPDKEEREYALMKGLQKLNQIDSILDEKLSGLQQHFAQQQAEQTQRAEAVRRYETGEAKFTTELDKLLEKAPELDSHRDSFISQHRAQPGLSAQEVAGWAADMAIKARVTRGGVKNAAARRQPRQASGPGGTGSGTGDTPSYEGMTIRDIVNAKRKELRDLG